MNMPTQERLSWLAKVERTEKQIHTDDDGFEYVIVEIPDGEKRLYLPDELQAMAFNAGF